MSRLTQVLIGLALSVMVSVTVWAAAPSNPEPWDAAYEAQPPSTDPLHQIDDWLNAIKTAVQQRLRVEHNFGIPAGGGASVAPTDDGTHRLGSSRCFLTSTEPSNLTHHDLDNTGAGPDGIILLTDTQTGGGNDLGDGRCWIDVAGPDNTSGTSDDHSYYVFDETAAPDDWKLISDHSFARGHIAGLTYAESPADEITVQPGEARNIGGSALNPIDTNNITLAAAMTKDLTTWVAATGNGGMSSSLTPIAASAEWYAVHLVFHETGPVTDICFDQSTTAATCIADHGFADYRTLGWFRTDATPNIIDFTQHSNDPTRVLWDSIQDAGGNSANTGGRTHSTPFVPPLTTGLFMVASFSGTNCTITTGTVYSQVVNTNPSANNYQVIIAGTGAGELKTHTTQLEIPMNSTPALFTDWSVSDSDCDYEVGAKGWVFSRGVGL